MMQRRAHLPRSVCSCDHWAIFDGIDSCVKCGRVWPAAYGKLSAGNPGYKLLLHAIDRQKTMPARGIR